MDSSHVSEEIMFLLEGEETILFSRTSLAKSQKPTEEQLRKDIIGVQLSYAYCGEQDFGIDPMARAFGATPKGVINQIPKDFNVYTQEDTVVLKYGSTSISPRMFDMAKEAGIVGYWDDANLIICASKEYEAIVKNMRKFIKPKKAKFAFRTVFGGRRNLMILAVN